jgi:hypothetical protein
MDSNQPGFLCIDRKIFLPESPQKMHAPTGRLLSVLAQNDDLSMRALPYRPGNRSPSDSQNHVHQRAGFYIAEN